MLRCTRAPAGIDHPLLGYGTYKVGVVPASASAAAKVTRTTDEVLKDALDVGYRMFDCAEFYGNEAGVGAASPPHPPPPCCVLVVLVPGAAHGEQLFAGKGVHV